MPLVSQLERLARPFPTKNVHANPSGGGFYVKHSVVNEKLLAVLGPFSFTIVELIRGDVAEIPANPAGKSDRARRGTPALGYAVVGVVCRLCATVDGRDVEVEEVGDCEQPHNWQTDGQRAKDAVSDALKRCAMRLGVGLHMWSQGEFTLYDQLSSRTEGLGEHPAEPATLAGPVQSPLAGPAEPVLKGRPPR
jgi:hypothetical protein